MKKRSKEMQTLCAGCSKAEPKFLPATDPCPGAWDGQNLISWRWSQFRIIMVTEPQTHPKPTDRTDYNTVHCSFASAQCYEHQRTRNAAQYMVFKCLIPRDALFIADVT